jgi:UDP-2,3-diacylglucosamine hydrolase
MRTIFLADAHLDRPADRNYRLLLDFLHSLRGTLETLFIMGDLFDFWVGFPSNPFCQYESVLAALEGLVESGGRIVYLEGNHDFHLGAVFRKRIRAEIHPGPVVVTLQGKRLYLCHGDQINRADRKYRFLRLILHSRITAVAIRFFPPSLALRIREHLQQTSRSGYRAREACWDSREIIRAFAGSIRRQGLDGLVTGHFHIACREQPEDGSFTILSLGDWMEQFTYGEMVDGELLLKTYPDP